MKQFLLVLLLFGASADKDGCREVEVEETRVCEEREVEECGLCATFHVRECTIHMEAAWVPVRVKRCVEGQQSAGCTRGGRQLCRTRYRTACGTRMEYHDMEEDYPKCRRERVNTCTEEEQEEEEVNNCREVEAMRCSIEKRTVRKAKPVSSCRRIPTKMCAKKKCKKVTNPKIFIDSTKIIGAPQMLRDSEDVSRGETEGTMQFETKTDMSRRWLQVILAIT